MWREEGWILYPTLPLALDNSNAICGWNDVTLADFALLYEIIACRVGKNYAHLISASQQAGSSMPVTEGYRSVPTLFLLLLLRISQCGPVFSLSKSLLAHCANGGICVAETGKGVRDWLVL